MAAAVTTKISSSKYYSRCGLATTKKMSETKKFNKKTVYNTNVRDIVRKYKTVVSTLNNGTKLAVAASAVVATVAAVAVAAVRRSAEKKRVRKVAASESEEE